MDMIEVRRRVMLSMASGGVAFKLWKIANVTQYAYYTKASDFITEYLTDLIDAYDNIVIFCDFVNNTTNTRAGIDYWYYKSTTKNKSSDMGHRVGGIFAGPNGCNVYEGSQIYIYYAIIDDLITH